MSGMTHEQMLHASPISMLADKSEIKQYDVKLPPRSNLKGAAPELNSRLATETSLTVNQEVTKGVNSNIPRMEYDMPSKNYFNHLDGGSTQDK